MGLPIRGLLAPGLVAAALAVALPATADEVVRVSGTGSAIALLQRLGDAFSTRNPGIRVKVAPSLGSSGAIHAVAEGALGLAVTGRPPTDAERERGLESVPLARTPFLFAAGPGVPVRGITEAELVRIYRGTVTTWPDGTRIRLVLRPLADSDSALLRAISPALDGAVAAAARRPGMLLAVTNTECDEMLARTPGSVGPSSLLQLRSEGRKLAALEWNGVAPTVENLDSGRYPLAKELHVVTRRDVTPAVRSFLGFVRSPEARALCRELGAIPAPAGG